MTDAPLITVAIHTMHYACSLKNLLEKEGLKVTLQNVNLSNPEIAAGQHKIPQGKLLIHALVYKALIDALIVPAYEDDILLLTQANGVSLRKGMAAGRKINSMNRPCRLIADGFPAAIQRICLHDGPPAAPIGIVIHLILLIGGIIPDLMRLNMDEAPLLGTSQNALGEYISQRIREQGQNINPHRCASPR